MDKQNVSNTVKYYSVLRKKEILTHATKWINLEDIMLSGIHQWQKDKYLHEVPREADLRSKGEGWLREAGGGCPRESVGTECGVSVLQDETCSGGGCTTECTSYLYNWLRWETSWVFYNKNVWSIQKKNSKKEYLMYTLDSLFSKFCHMPLPLRLRERHIHFFSCSIPKPASFLMLMSLFLIHTKNCSDWQGWHWESAVS